MPLFLLPSVVSPQSVQSSASRASSQANKTKYSSVNCNKHSPYPSPHESPHPSNVSPARYTPQDSPVARLSSTQESPAQHSPYSTTATDQSSKFIAAHKYPNIAPPGGGFTPPSSVSQGCETIEGLPPPPSQDQLLNNIKATPPSEYPAGATASINKHQYGSVGTPMPIIGNLDPTALNQLNNFASPLPGKERNNGMYSLSVNLFYVNRSRFMRHGDAHANFLRSFPYNMQFVRI